MSGGYRRFYTQAQLDQAWRANDLRVIKERLLSNYAEVDGGYSTLCWKWLGPFVTGGYGRVSWNNCDYRAHRYSWICHYGEIQEDLFCCHFCDNPWCIRPSHLFIDTPQGNVDDMIAKGRDAYDWAGRGENNGLTHLTDEQVLDIRRKLATGMTQREVAEHTKLRKPPFLTSTLAIHGPTFCQMTTSPHQ
jgi:hypothetical protein